MSLMGITAAIPASAPATAARRSDPVVAGRNAGIAPLQGPAGGRVLEGEVLAAARAASADSGYTSPRLFHYSSAAASQHRPAAARALAAYLGVAALGGSADEAGSSRIAAVDLYA